MKKLKFVSALLAITLFVSCSDDDVRPSNEEEVITTLTATFTPQGGGTPVVLTSRDLDGDGPDEPVITVSGDFAAGMVYNGAVTFLNEMESPAENITAEVEEEGTEHQVFFIAGGSLGTFEYADEDTDGNPVGLNVIYTASATPATGTLTIRLIHAPSKDAPGVADGIIDNAGGSTDATATFTITVN